MPDAAAKPVAWGVVGTGWVAADFVVPAMLGRAGTRLLACAGSGPEKARSFAQRFGFERAHADIDALLADPEVDAVYLATPNAMHHAHVLAAARAGKHVLCEKPLAMTAQQAREMVDACRKAGVLLRIAHQIRTDEAILRAREVIASGRLGRLAAVAIERSSALGQRQPWRTDFAQSGVVFDVCVHLLDLIQFVTGKRFLEVCAFSHPDRRARVPDDTITVLGRLEGDVHAVARATREVAQAENNLVVEGAQGSLVTSPLRFAKEHWVRVRDASGATEDRYPASPIYARQMAAFETELRGGERGPLPDGEDAAYIVAVTQAVLQSIEERRIVSVDCAG